MNINSAFPSNYLKAADLQGRTIEVTIQRVSMEDIGGDTKPVLYFQNKERGLVLNKTNATTIASLHGAETDHWAGRSIHLYPTRTDYQGRQVDCIRVQMETGDPYEQPQVTPPAQPSTANGQDDDIPF